MAPSLAPSRVQRIDLVVLAALLLVSVAVAGLSAAVTAQNVNVWYATLAKPAFNPPNWLFGPVWTVLYVVMAIAAWRVWLSRRRQSVALPLSFYAAQMVLNFAWSPLFFGLHHIGVALIDIVGLSLMLAATASLFWRRDRLAGALMVPYLAWVLFATTLNFAIWRLS